MNGALPGKNDCEDLSNTGEDVRHKRKNAVLKNIRLYPILTEVMVSEPPTALSLKNETSSFFP